jgi:hypothetical protein
MPLCIVLAWWFWGRDRSNPPANGWRNTALIIGLVAASANALVFGVYLAYSSRHPPGTGTWKFGDTCGNIGAILCTTAFICSAAAEGEDRARILVSVSAVLGFLLWVPIGIL